FLFVSPHICRLLPLDSQSPATPLLLANPSYYKAGSGLAPYSRLPCPAHHSEPIRVYNRLKYVISLSRLKEIIGSYSQ
ncbi:hypothetical protein, partial [Olivibacter jilunii]|uniref:hypothetical protein n=1 Tax=Olivibacter jilunii TaxID=985016 RepID=UPI003F152D37